MNTRDDMPRVFEHCLHVALLGHAGCGAESVNLLNSSVNILNLLLELAFLGANYSIEEFTYRRISGASRSERSTDSTVRLESILKRLLAAL